MIDQKETPKSEAALNLSVKDRYKRWYDLTILLVAHVFLLPIWLVLWTIIPIVIWVGDRGPIFYCQDRAGQGGRVFKVRKFRTMVPDAEQTGPAWTTEGDPRVTRVGKILRRTALDELPEVLSIWSGDMSLVGPRALDVGEHRSLEKGIQGFSERLRIRPGLTGLAQVYDRMDSADEKFKYDLRYLQEMNPLLDTKLLILSVYYTVAARWDRRSGKGANGVQEESRHNG